MRCSGRYTLHEDSEHANSAEIQLDRELRLNEIEPHGVSAKLNFPARSATR